MKLVRPINLCVNGINSKTHVYESLTDSFFIQNAVKGGYNLLALFFNFGLEYKVRKVQEELDRLKLIGTLLVYAADDNIAGEIVNTIKE
jgi:hypothetical protein